MGTAIQVDAYPAIAKDAGISEDIWLTLTSSIYPGARPLSILLAYRYCQARRLDVLKKPVHIVPMYVKDAQTGEGKMRDVVMPGVQELRVTASRTLELAGQDEPAFGPMVEMPITNAHDAPDDVKRISVPESCKITVYRMVRTSLAPDSPLVRQAFTAEEFFEECCARDKSGRINDMWQRRKRGQLAKCAAAAALRMAFPEEIGNTYTVEEMEGKTIDNGAIDGDFTVVGKGDEVPDPVEIDDVPEPKAAPPQEAKSVADTNPNERAAAAATQQRPAQTSEEQSKRTESKPTTRPLPEVKDAEPDKPKASAAAASDLTIDLPQSARNILNRKLAEAGLAESDLLGGYGKSVTVATVNGALDWIKAHGKKE